MASSLQLLQTRDQARRAVSNVQAVGKRVAVVMTMGALHEGHLSLVRHAKTECDFVVVTVFVNPSQFGPSDDLDRYPRNLASDVEKLEALEVDLVFAPGDDEMYPPGFSTYVQPPDVADSWEGTFRPDHFRGVTTIVLKLLHVIPADMAFFGHKDFQQYLVIKRMAIDLDVATEIRVCPTRRGEDGLALSSRNAYLSAQDHQRALAISRALRIAEELASGGERRAATIQTRMQRELTSSGIDRIDYVALVDPDNLRPIDQLDGDTLALIAAHVGGTRLIDNLLIELPR